MEKGRGSAWAVTGGSGANGLNLTEIPKNCNVQPVGHCKENAVLLLQSEQVKCSCR